MRPVTRKGLLAGAITGLIISLFHSQMFKFDLFGWSGLVAWYLLSLLVGCGIGFLADLLSRLIPVKVNSSLVYFGGALFGAFGYLIQVYLLLLYMFKHTSWE